MKTPETHDARITAAITQRLIRALDRDYNRAVSRLLKWTEQVSSTQLKITALEKNIKSIERELDKLTQDQDMSLQPTKKEQHENTTRRTNRPRAR